MERPGGQWDVGVVLRDERGQTSIEWVGVVVVVALLVLALVRLAPSVGGQLTGKVEAVICSIGGEGCHSSSTPGPARDRAAAEPPHRRPSAARPSAERGRGGPAPHQGQRGGRDRSPLGRELQRAGAHRGDLAAYRLGVVDDILNFLAPPPSVANLHGTLAPINELGFPLPIRQLARLFGLAEEVAARVGRYAKRFGTAAEVLVATQRYTGNLAKALQEALPAASRGRVTMAVGVGKDSKGVLRVVVGTSERNGYLRSGVADKLKDAGGATVAKTSSGHAEINVLETMKAMGLKPVTVGAGRPICPGCASAIRQAGGTFASPVK